MVRQLKPLIEYIKNPPPYVEKWVKRRMKP